MFSPLSVPSLDCMNVKTRRRETLGKARFKETRVILTTQLNPWYVCLNIPRVKFFAKFESSLKNEEDCRRIFKNNECVQIDKRMLAQLYVIQKVENELFEKTRVEAADNLSVGSFDGCFQTKWSDSNEKAKGFQLLERGYVYWPVYGGWDCPRYTVSRFDFLAFYRCQCGRSFRSFIHVVSQEKCYEAYHTYTRNCSLHIWFLWCGGPDPLSAR